MFAGHGAEKYPAKKVTKFLENCSPRLMGPPPFIRPVWFGPTVVQLS